jgi:hypothetical protein
MRPYVEVARRHPYLYSYIISVRSRSEADADRGVFPIVNIEKLFLRC